MPDEATVLISTAAAVAFVHTLLGPDHYLVFSAMAKANGWTMAKTLRITALCGIGHVLGSVLLGCVGIVLGVKLAVLTDIEGARGSIAGWALLAFGLVYLVWGLRRALRKRTHSHLHRHGDIVHSHPHDHAGDHAHVHLEKGSGTITPWAMFIIFVLGPCEALIPLFMYPAAQQSTGLVFSVALVFGLVTLLTMLLAVALVTKGLQNLRFQSIGRYAHAVAGGSIVACGAAINFAGL